MKKNIIIIVTTVLLAFCHTLSAENQDNLVDVNIYSNVKQIQRGSDFYIAIKLSVADEWHVYWKNPGDSGLPTEVKWNTPKGVEAVDGLIWQVPEKIEWDGNINYGFEHDVYLIQKFKTTRVSDFKKLEIEAEVNWLVCKEKCIPQDDKVSIELAVDELFEKSEYDELILELLASAPKKFISKNSNFEAEDESLEIFLKEMPLDVEKVKDIYVITDGMTDNSFKTKIENSNNEVTAKFKISPYSYEIPTELEILVLYEDKNGKLKSYETIISN